MSYTKIRVMGQPDEIKAITYVITKALDEHHPDSMKAFQIGQEPAEELVSGKKALMVCQHTDGDDWYSGHPVVYCK